MTGIATVKSADGKYAVIEVSRKAMCDGCHNSDCGGSCPMSGLFSSGKTMTAKAVNQIGAKAGDIVEIETSDREVLSSALCVFILPLIVAAAFYTLASLLSVDIRICTILSAVGFVVPFPFLRLLENKKNKKTPQISVIRIITDADIH